ncbi:SseB family protein [Streptomyces armeniacus]|uniref:SseB family protein n=1 Tax=Streptomyces armeniacus TaxID=83291 RepID=A0A345XP82_9ACTN|nr:SseB family protein [Streptomyces armeniacus]AXK33448.1 SseB family protein [Streptomyces armeniacus]
MDLPEEIAACRAGDGDPAALLGEFRRTAVLVPVDGDVPRAAVYGGIRWIYAFTDEAALHRFADARDADARTDAHGTAPPEPRDYLPMPGARLLDHVIPASDGPTGVALNVADEHGSMLFPPVRGIVPPEAAVDRDPSR